MKKLHGCFAVYWKSNLLEKKFDALLIVSFGGPEGMDDVIPFLDNVLRGKNVPEERKMEVAHHYEMFGGVSPINAQNRELKSLLEEKLKQENIELPVFWGNRNWKPYLKDALIEMKQKGVKNALAYFTSAYASYSGCRQYQDNIEDARKLIGEEAPNVQRLALFFDHPNFIQANVERIQEQLANVSDPTHNGVHLVFTAHSIPISMAKSSAYVDQLNRACELVAEKVGVDSWKLAFQSRSGPPQIPWLEPDINDHLKTVQQKKVIVSPIGFVSDHMEVIYDLDVEAKQTAEELGLGFFRTKSAGNHPLMIEMIVDLVKNQKVMVCKPDCCSPPRRPG